LDSFTKKSQKILERRVKSGVESNIFETDFPALIFNTRSPAFQAILTSVNSLPLKTKCKLIAMTPCIVIADAEMQPL